MLQHHRRMIFAFLCCVIFVQTTIQVFAESIDVLNVSKQKPRAVADPSSAGLLSRPRVPEAVKNEHRLNLVSKDMCATVRFKSQATDLMSCEEPFILRRAVYLAI